MTLLYDSDQPSAIPADAPAVCLYDDGEPGSIASRNTFDRFSPSCPKVVAVRRVVAIGPVYAGGAVVADVETGAMGIGTLRSWLPMQRRVSTTCRAGVYVSLANWPAARVAVRNAGLIPPDWWVAAWVPAEVPPLIPGAVARQFASTSTSGGHYDLSITVPTWPPGPPQEDTMQLYISAFTPAGGTEGQYLVNLAVPWKLAIATPDDEVSFLNAGAKPLALSQTMMGRIRTA